MKKIIVLSVLFSIVFASSLFSDEVIRVAASGVAGEICTEKPGKNCSCGYTSVTSSRILYQNFCIDKSSLPTPLSCASKCSTWTSNNGFTFKSSSTGSDCKNVECGNSSCSSGTNWGGQPGRQVMLCKGANFHSCFASTPSQDREAGHHTETEVRSMRIPKRCAVTAYPEKYYGTNYGNGPAPSVEFRTNVLDIKQCFPFREGNNVALTVVVNCW